MELKEHFTDEKTGISYTLKGDYYYPDLTLPEQTHDTIGKYGNLRLDFIKKHRKGFYTTVLMDGTLNAHLHEIDEQAKEMVHRITADLAKARDINEALKSTDQLRWVAEMNNCKAAAEESVLNDLIYT